MQRLYQIIGLVFLLSSTSFTQGDDTGSFKILKGNTFPTSNFSLPVKSRAGQPIKKRIFANRYKIKPPAKRKLLPTPRIIVPGKKGILIPDQVELEGTKSRIKFSPPIDAQPFRMRENATRNIRYIDTDQGLSSQMITNLMKDSRGNLWMTTYGEGITRFDGRKILSLQY